MTSRATKKRAARPTKPKPQPKTPDHVAEADLLRLRLSIEKVTRLRAEQRAIAAELVAAQGEAQRAQIVLASKYRMGEGDQIEPNGLIIRSNGQGGPPQLPPQPPQDTNQES